MSVTWRMSQGFAAMALWAVTAIAAPAAEVVVFEDAGFAGTSIRYNADVPNLVDEGFNDIISSIRIVSGRWQVCEHVNYQGRCRTIDANTPNVGPEWNDQISSLREVRGGGGGDRPGITLWEEPAFGGASVTFRTDIPNLDEEGFDDSAASLKIRGGAWEVCENPNYRGRCRRFERDSDDLTPIGWAGRISSVRRAPVDGGGGGPVPRGLTVYEDVDYGGVDETITRDIPDLRAVDFDNIISSLKIRGGSWQVCEGYNYTGRCRVVDADTPSVLPWGMNDKISSVRKVEDVVQYPVPPGAQNNTNRPGSDYDLVSNPRMTPDRCKTLCEGDTRCRAWTFVRPSIQGGEPECHLKNRIPVPQNNPCCVSGVNRPAEPVLPGMTDNTNRVGNDYRNFPLTLPNPQVCQQTCENDRMCSAWTYIRPGVLGPRARCALKRPAPNATPDPCCISGVNRTMGGEVIGPGMRDNTDRPGFDLRSFPIRGTNPGICQQACLNELSCRAWVYVRPGVRGPRAQCDLKSLPGPRIPDNCCISGRKFGLF